MVDFPDIPIIICNRNRLTPLRDLVDWLQAAGHESITVLDNASTYPPLLEYYESERRSLQVRKLGRNMGPYALWTNELRDLRARVPFIYSDSDVVPDPDCPQDLAWLLLEIARRYDGRFKVGAGLRIDNLPSHYSQAARVRRWEERFWRNKLRDANSGKCPLYLASVDTTFAVYLSGDNVSQGIRTGGPYWAQHRPWYLDSSNPTEEELYYEQSASTRFTNWGLTDCHSKAVMAVERCSSKPEPALTHWTKVPMAVDMAPYAPWYQEQVKRVALEAQDRPIVLVETGVRHGCSARIMIDALRDRDSWSLHLVDPEPTPYAAEVVNNYRHCTYFHKVLGETAAPIFQDGSIDLLHIDADCDGNHPYEMAWTILTAYWRKISPGGRVILHDCTDRFPGILRLAHEMVRHGQWTMERAQPQPECPISAPAVLTRDPDFTADLRGISVVVPVLVAKWLPGLLAGLENGEVLPSEVIVIDNSGNQAARSICASWTGLPIRYLPQAENLGVNRSWNLGLLEAENEVVAILNDDLLLPPGLLKSFIDVFGDMPNTGYVVPATLPDPRHVSSGPGAPFTVPLAAREGWAFAVRKTWVDPIPDTLHTFYGDDWFFHQVREAGGWCLKVLNQRIFHYVGISKNVAERSRLGLPSLSDDRQAWEAVQRAGRPENASKAG